MRTFGIRAVAASLMGLVSLIGGIVIAFLALAFADAGSELSPAVSLAFVLAAPFGAAVLITRVLPPPPHGWSAFLVGLGGCAGLLLVDQLGPMLPGYPLDYKQSAQMTMLFGLPFLGAFLGTYGRTPRTSKS